MPAAPTDRHGIPVGQDFAEADAALMVELDFLMAEGLGIGLPQMKENAGRALARLAVRRYFPAGPDGRRIVALAGKGGNGDVLLLAARRLAGWGAAVVPVIAAPEAALGAGVRAEVAILRRMGIEPHFGVPADVVPDLILDGLIGYSLRGAPRGRPAELVYWANACAAPVLSLDVPTGFDAQEGVLLEPAIRADATLALGLPKRGLAAACFAHAVGDLYVGDISVPREAWGRLSVPLMPPPFGGADVLRLLRPRES